MTPFRPEDRIGDRVMDDGRREIHGGTMAAGMQDTPILVIERDDAIWISQNGIVRHKLAAHSARFLARKLNRLALRIEKRLNAQPGSAVVPIKASA